MHIFKTKTDPDVSDLASREDLNVTAMWQAIESGDHVTLAEDWCCATSLVTLAIEESAGDPELASSLFTHLLQESLS